MVRLIQFIFNLCSFISPFDKVSLFLAKVKTMHIKPIVCTKCWVLCSVALLINTLIITYDVIHSAWNSFFNGHAKNKLCREKTSHTSISAWSDFPIKLLSSAWTEFGDKQGLIYTSSISAAHHFPVPDRSSWTSWHIGHVISKIPAVLLCSQLLCQHSIWWPNFTIHGILVSTLCRCIYLYIV